MNLDRYLARWNALPVRTRLGIGAAFVLAIALGALATYAARDRRVALFTSGLASDQLAEVDAQLSAWNVAFVPGVDNVRVDPRLRAELAARLAGAGVPHAHLVGTSEALATVGTLTPQAVLEARARTGLEGDLEKGLRGMGGIADARVILAPARNGIFADEQATDASASVRISAVPGGAITTATLAAVRAFVAAAIPGLQPGRVTVVDDRGEVANEDDREAPALERGLQSALDAAFGADATIVRVSLERDDRTRESHELRRVPYGAAIARTSVDERLTAEKKKYAKIASSEDRGSNERDERVTTPPGGIARLSVAVIVDARRGLDLAKIREVAAAAAGVDKHRGDVLSVEAVPFDRPRAAQPGLRYAFGLAAEIVPIAVFAAIAIVAARVAARPLATLAAEGVRLLRRRETVRTAAGLAPGAVFEVLRGEPPHVAAAIIATLATPAAAAVLERYPADERAAIAARLARRVSPLIPDAERLLRER